MSFAAGRGTEINLATHGVTEILSIKRFSNQHEVILTSKWNFMRFLSLVQN
jgi:hypothetical protein